MSGNIDTSATEASSEAIFSDINALPEWELLVGGSVLATPEATKSQADTEAELKRTQCSLNCLTYIYQGGEDNYAALTEVQPEAVKLKSEEFDELHEYFTTTLSDQETFQTMQYIMVIHDVGKNTRIFEEMDVDPRTTDHDEILSRLLNAPEYNDKRQELLPSFAKLSESQQKIVQDVFRVQLNFGQFMQGEAPAAAVQGIPAELDEKTRSMYVMHAMLDIAGVVGHVNPNSSVILNSPTYKSMMRANAALSSDDYTNAIERYDAYLAYRAEQLEVKMQGLNEQDVAEAKAKVRLACMLRYATPEEMTGLNEAFENTLPPVKAILMTELNRDGVNDRATLPYYGPALLKSLSEKQGISDALHYFAHVMQEAHIADAKARARGETGVITAELGELTRIFNKDTSDPEYVEPSHAAIRFEQHGEMLVPHIIEPTIATVENLPVFEAEKLKDRRLLLLGMGGGSDGIQAAMLGKLFEEKFSSQTMAVVSVRGGDKDIVNPGRAVGWATRGITNATEALGNWRFLEHIPVENQTDPTPMFLLRSTDSAIIQHDVSELARQMNVDVVVAVDTGGDSLFRADNLDHDGVDTSPDQDITVLKALASLEGAGSVIENVYSVVVAPGIDSPPYAKEYLDDAGASRFELDQADKDAVVETYAQWRMDGSASEEGRYGKTPFVWLEALKGRRGLTAVALPAANVVSADNPWRPFVDITPAMADVVIMDARKHAALIGREVSPAEAPA